MSTGESVRAPKKRIHVVGAAISRAGLVLAARRGAGMTLPGFWEFPGGKVEVGETPRQALHRELHEELGCEAQIGDEVVTVEHEYDFGIVVLTVFTCELLSGQPTASEHSEVRWVPAARLDTLTWAPADVPAVAKLVAQAGEREG